MTASRPTDNAAPTPPPLELWPCLKSYPHLLLSFGPAFPGGEAVQMLPAVCGHPHTIQQGLKKAQPPYHR